MANISYRYNMFEGFHALTLKDQIAIWLKGCKRLVILGIGNTLREDDAVGIEIVKLLNGKVPRKVKLIECETSPENFLDEIEQFNPTHVLMIDAAHLKMKPGEAELISHEKLSGTAFSTHALPLSLMTGIVKESLNAEVMLLCVQPKSAGFGEMMSAELRKASKNIANIIIEATRQIC